MRQIATGPQDRSGATFSPQEAPTPRSRLRAELAREDWALRLEHEQRSGAILTLPDPVPGVYLLVERCAARLGFKRAPWIYDVGLEYLRASLKGPGPSRPEPQVAPGLKRAPKARGRAGPTWAARLLPLLQTPGVEVEFTIGTARSARVLAHKLNSGMKPRPPGRWEFSSRGNVMRARYLGAAWGEGEVSPA